MDDVIVCGGFEVAVRAARADAPLVWLHAGGNDPEDWACVSETAAGARVSVAAIRGADWNRDLTPWPMRADLRGGTDFAGGADAYLKRLESEVFPEVLSRFSLAPALEGIAGYSLAGLFALYAATRLERFSAAASVSGSLWYDGFPEYLARARRLPVWAYLSLGDREGRGRGVFARNDEALRATERALELRGVRTRLEMNPGGHFTQPALRLAKGIRQLAEWMNE